ncbi:putative bifunctional diguanylate cyclase/phosphodiesterase [Demequina aurantiaca]|uniref:putative bifunctional diguanylate cyclase/phosphodiesterase n=1 Tax=Demequina aurantiaca TaxID=676200 RepID=UPI003D34F768
MKHDGTLFDSTFRDSPIGIALIDEAGTYVALNDAFARMLGRDSADVVGSHYSTHTHPDDLRRDREMMTAATSGSLPYYQAQKRFVHRNGDTVWTRVTVSDVTRNEDSGRHTCVLQIEDVTEVRRAKELLQRRAQYDHLTGLPNRSLLIETLTRTLAKAAHASPIAVLFIDIDHFKLINDSLGHDAGDQAIVEIARRISGAVRPSDLVARLGGDEFVVVLSSILSENAAQGLLAVVTDAVQAPLDVADHTIQLTISTGIALSDYNLTAETLVRRSDLAMYAAKQAGRARSEVFRAEVHANALSRLSVEAELRTALTDGQLRVHYQPVVDLRNREIVSYEALVRWEHPTRGLLLPQEFIEVCEEANLVIELGRLVLIEACHFIASRPEFRGKVLVNVSTRQVGSADLSRVVKSVLKETGVGADRLALEITESGMLATTPAEQSDLKRLAAMGVDLIIDDFGTGYSSLSSVLQNPVAGLKLAREFTLRLGDRSTGDRISTAIAGLTASLEMYGVIEGIETEAQYTIARRHGWKYGQGFLFGHAEPADSIGPHPTVNPEHADGRAPGATPVALA